MSLIRDHSEYEFNLKSHC